MVLFIGYYNIEETRETVSFSIDVYGSSDSYDGDVPGWALYVFTILAIMGVIFMLVIVCAIIRGTLNQSEESRNRVRIAP
jgi:hypothetical protein